MVLGLLLLVLVLVGVVAVCVLMLMLAGGRSPGWWTLTMDRPIGSGNLQASGAGEERDRLPSINKLDRFLQGKLGRCRGLHGHKAITLGASRGFVHHDRRFFHLTVLLKQVMQGGSGSLKRQLTHK